MTDCYVGIMSGTSLDGIDAGLFSFDSHRCNVIGTQTLEFDDAVQQQLRQFANGAKLSAQEIGQLDSSLSNAYASATNALKASSASQIKAIGCHGQTVWHQPEGENGFSWQLGNPHILAAQTGITTVADFRRADIAAGGQGAPLAPLFHQWLWPAENVAVINIGGIANITPPSGKGFDCGPGNTLMDAWTRRHLDKAFDEDGAWANSGHCVPTLLRVLKNDSYFSLPQPKSTGPEYFNLSWLDSVMNGESHEPADVQATLLELTAWSIAEVVIESGAQRAIICGGGAFNSALMGRLQTLCPLPVESSILHGLDPQWVEAACFAWLAKQAIEGRKIDTQRLTGAKRPVNLGVIYPA